MKYLAAASTAIQLVYLLSLLRTINSTIELIHNDSLWDSGDPKTMAGAISVVLTSQIIGAAIGSVGVFPAWLVLRDGDSRPSWFLKASTLFAWIWMAFIPIGTVIGVSMLRWCRPIPVAGSGNQT